MVNMQIDRFFFFFSSSAAKHADLHEVINSMLLPFAILPRSVLIDNNGEHA